MPVIQPRIILNVTCRERIWRVEHGDDAFGHSTEKEIARAAAMRRARELHDGGGSCQIVVHGEQIRWGGAYA